MFVDLGPGKVSGGATSEFEFLRPNLVRRRRLDLEGL